MSRAAGRVHAIDAHAGGAAVRLIVDGFPSPRGRTLVERRAWIDRRPTLVSALIREPRGHADLMAAMLTDPVADGAAAGLLFLGGAHPPAISGAGLMAAMTVAIERGLLVPATPDDFLVETTAGVVRVRPDTTVDGDSRRVREVRYQPPPAYVSQAALPVTVQGRRVRVDVAWASGWYAIVDRESLGVPPERGWADLVRRAALQLAEALQPQVSGWPAPPGLTAPLEGIVLTGPPGRGDADLRSLTVYADGTIDRSPSGGGTLAVLAVLDAMGVLEDAGRGLHHEGPAGLTFRARVVARVRVGDQAAIVAELSGQAWITTEHTLVLDPGDPLVDGFQI